MKREWVVYKVESEYESDVRDAFRKLSNNYGIIGMKIEHLLGVWYLYIDVKPELEDEVREALEVLECY